MTSGIPFYTADVFTGEMFGGNQLAVFPTAGGLDTPLMQAIARELNLPETVFVFPPDDPARTTRLRIFTPRTELPFAGHPTLGAAFVLASIGEVALDGSSTSVVFEEGVGPISVTIRAEGGRPTYCTLTVARLPEFGPPPPPVDEIAAVLSLHPDDIRVDGFYPFAEATGRRGADIRARMFAPELGIAEDPATGAAAAALAGYLAATLPPGNGTLRWIVDQGIEMGRPSRLHVECDRDGERIMAVRVGGSAVMVAEGTLAVPST